MAIPPWAFDITREELVALIYLGCKQFWSIQQEILPRHTPQVVFGDLTSPLDCGLYVGKHPIETFDGLTPKQKLAQIIEISGDQEVILPMELRFGCSVFGPPGPNRHNSHYLMRLSPEQQKCELVILGQPKRPNLVAVIPRYYLRPSDNGVVSSKWYPPFVPEAFFAVEYSPFVIPTAKVPIFLQQFISYYHGDVSTVINPHNGIEFKNLPALKTQTPRCLAAEGSVRETTAEEREGLLQHMATEIECLHTLGETRNLPKQPLSDEFSQLRFEAAQINRLNDLCMQSKFGIVYYLPAHKGGRAAIAPWTWSEEDVNKYMEKKALPRAFCERGPTTKMMYLNFAKVSLVDSLAGSDEGHYLSYLHATHSGIESLYILCPMSEGVAGTGQNRFLVPSSQLNTPPRRGRMQAFVENGVMPEAEPLYLNNGGLVDMYGAHERQIIPLMRRILLEDCNEDGTITFDISGSLNVGDLLNDHKDVNELFLETLEDDGESWFVKYRS